MFVLIMKQAQKDSNVWGNATFNDLKQAAEKALDVLIQQPEVDVNKITYQDISKGTMIAPYVYMLYLND